MACTCNATRLTVFPSDAVRGFRLAMSRAFSVSADRTFVWASLHLVRGHRIWRPIAHLVVAVKACGLALWLRFMGLKRTVHSRIVEICSISHSGVLTSQSGDPLSWMRAFLFLLTFLVNICFDKSNWNTRAEVRQSTYELPLWSNWNVSRQLLITCTLCWPTFMDRHDRWQLTTWTWHTWYDWGSLLSLHLWRHREQRLEQDLNDVFFFYLSLWKLTFWSIYS